MLLVRHGYGRRLIDHIRSDVQLPTSGKTTRVVTFILVTDSPVFLGVDTLSRFFGGGGQFSTN